MTTRRDFLKGACAIAALSLGPALLADDAMAADGIHRRKNGQVALHVAKVAELARVGGAVNLGTVNGVPVAVVRTGTSSYEALSLRCPHQGVTVRASGSGWQCPAHGSAFALDGALRQGPARTGLTVVRSSFNGRRVLVG